MPELIAYRTRVTVTPGNEVEAAFDSALDLLKFFQQAAARPVSLLPKAGQLLLELSGELINEPSLPRRISLSPVSTRSSNSWAPIPRSASQVLFSRRAEQ